MLSYELCQSEPGITLSEIFKEKKVIPKSTTKILQQTTFSNFVIGLRSQISLDITCRLIVHENEKYRKVCRLLQS